MKLTLCAISICLSWMLDAQNMPKTILWEISKKGQKHTSYLLGTFHDIEGSFFSTLDSAVEKLKNSEIVFVEEINKPALDLETAKTQLSSWDKTQWDTLLTSTQKPVFQAFIKKAERSDFYKLPPLILARTIVGMYLTEFCQAESTTTMDASIEKLARQNGKNVLSLDDNQIEMLKKTSLLVKPTQNSIYAEYCTNLMGKMLNDDFSDCQILQHYKKFDIDYSLDLDLTQIPNYSPLLIDRNEKWVKKLKKPLKSHNCFIAVGLAHLFYKQGLIQQLRAVGYKVKPLSI
jgi:uncharacterized protein